MYGGYASTIPSSAEVASWVVAVHPTFAVDPSSAVAEVASWVVAVHPTFAAVDPSSAVAEVPSWVVAVDPTFAAAAAHNNLLAIIFQPFD